MWKNSEVPTALSAVSDKALTSQDSFDDDTLRETLTKVRLQKILWRMGSDGND